MLLYASTLFFCLSALVECKEWSYETMQKWSRDNRYCAGHLQSPIDLPFNISHHDRRLRTLVFEDRHTTVQPELINNGHTAQLNLKSSIILKHAAPQSEDYNVEQIHFHWGHRHDDTNGSEHSLEGKFYPLEMHVVTYSSLFTSIRDAMTNVRGLAVVGFFFELSDETNPLLQTLVDALAHVRREGARVQVDQTFNLKALVGETRMRRYYRYDGSLTTPPCYESVLWSVVQEPIKLSRQQLQAFKILHKEQNKLLENTYRTVQPLGSRKLFRSFVHQDQHDESKRQPMEESNSGQNLVMKTNVFLMMISLFIAAY